MMKANVGHEIIMPQDLKIELSKILALHEASLRMEHAIRESMRKNDPWKDFAPSRFIYAFFAFNTIYSWDWESSFKANAPTRWEKKANDHYPDEEEQFKGYVRFCDASLGADTVRCFQRRFAQACEIMGLSDPSSHMTRLDVTNADKKLKKLKDQMPELVKRLHEGTVQPRGFHSTASHVLKFVYGVRCNLFHGRKKHVQMLDPEQQVRLLVYAALLAAANGLLFDVVAKLNIGFMPVEIEFLHKQGPTNACNPTPVPLRSTGEVDA